MMQIFLPVESVRQFAYPSYAWGHPMLLYHRGDVGPAPPSAGADADSEDEEELADVVAFTPYNTDKKRHFVPPPTTETPTIDFARFLRTSCDIDYTQGRIMSHPHLFRDHGAFSLMYHGDPRFNALRFRARMLELLWPFITRKLQSPEQWERLKYIHYTAVNGAKED